MILSAFLLAVAVGADFLAPAMTDQVASRRQQLPRFIASIQMQLGRSEWGREFLSVLFISFEPRLHRRALELMVPTQYRRRAGEVLDQMWQTLWWWLAARGAAMLFVGITITIELTILKVPLALTFGCIAAVLDFVPNFGPIVARAAPHPGAQP